MAIAERVNGILKTEWLDRMKKFSCFEEAQKEMERIIAFYNDKRPHMSIDMLTPSQAYEMDGVLKKRWKEKDYEKKEDLSKEICNLASQDEETKGNGVSGNTVTICSPVFPDTL